MREKYNKCEREKVRGKEQLNDLNINEQQLQFGLTFLLVVSDRRLITIVTI